MTDATRVDARRCSAKLADLDAEHAKAVAGGGEKYVDRHHARGKLLPRERIELLVDEGTRVPRAVAAGRLGLATSPSARSWSPASASSRASSA